MPAFNFFIFGFSILLIIVAGVILWRSGVMQTETGLPTGKVVYADDERWYEQHEPLSVPDLRLTGKPDYLVEQPDGMLIPVEIKSRTAPVSPHEGHIFQLAAYCMLVWRAFGVRPDFGILQYEDRSFEIPFDDDLENDLLDLLAEMREDMFDDDLPRDHDDWRRCRRCGVREFCNDRLE